MGVLRLFLISAFALAGVALHAATENELKVAYVLKFAGFATWPPDASGNTFVIGVAGGSDIVGEMERAAVGVKIRGKVAVVRKVSSAGDAAGCQLLYIASGTSSSLISSVSTLPVLTVGESERFNGDGGIIAMKKVGTKLRFTVNQSAASRARIELSAQLLKLSTSEK
jgi:hypothetical protein